MNIALSVLLFLKIVFGGMNIFFVEPHRESSQTHNVVYWLQNYEYDKDPNKAIETIARGKADLLILDLYKNDNYQTWTQTETKRMRGLNEDKRIVYYVSLGEAENYRDYWQQDWNTNKPSWMATANPDYPDNFKVRYWADAWKNIVKKYIDKVVEAGADGVFFDVVDAYDYWEEKGTEQEKRIAREQMKKVVLEMAEYARKKSDNQPFGVYVNNGPELLEDAEYRKTITGIIYEDLWYDGDEKRDEHEVRRVMNYLDLLRTEGKTVTIIQYSKNQQAKEYSRQKAQEAGYDFVNLRRKLDQYPEEQNQGNDQKKQKKNTPKKHPYVPLKSLQEKQSKEKKKQ